jgi:RNA polymerase sigma-70 factor (sigma-E family)
VSQTEEYAELVAARAPALLRLAVMLTGDRTEAEDLLQATLLRTQRHADRIAAMAAPVAYLRTALMHEHVSGLRRLGRRVRTSALEGHDRQGADEGAAVDQRDATWRLLATLPRQQRAVLALRYYEDLPDREIAEALRCSEQTVRSNASRALARLRIRLTENEEAL